MRFDIRRRMLLLCVGELIYFTVGELGAVDTGHHILAVLGEAPVAPVNVVVSGDAVNDLT